MSLLVMEPMLVPKKGLVVSGVACFAPSGESFGGLSPEAVLLGTQCEVNRTAVR